MVTLIKKCRLCRGKLKIKLSFRLPLVNSFPKVNEIKSEKEYPLKFAVCFDCQLLQLATIINPEELFRQYDYLTGASVPLVRHIKKLAQYCEEKYDLKVGARILDIGCNDGTLLKNFLEKGFSVLGVEPVRNIAKIAVEAGIPVIKGYFDSTLAGKILKKEGDFNLIFSTHSLANVLDINSFIKGAKLLLSPAGTLVIEVADSEEMLKNSQFDSIYHEHYSYFTRRTLKLLLERNGFTVMQIRKVATQGGSVQVFARGNLATSDVDFKKSIKDQLLIEKFTQTVEEYRRAVRVLFEKIKEKKVFAFGAPAKGVTFLNYCGLNFKNIVFAVDSTPFKVGKYIPGTQIRVFEESCLGKARVDYCLLLSWNYQKGILRKIEKLGKKIKVIIPFPKLRILKD